MNGYWYCKLVPKVKKYYTNYFYTINSKSIIETDKTFIKHIKLFWSWINYWFSNILTLLLYVSSYLLIIKLIIWQKKCTCGNYFW